MLPLLLALVTAPTASACGGLFCDALTMEPVDQKAERILFQMNDDGTITTFVEISYVGRAEQFAWVLPIPHVIDADAVATTDAAFFDALEGMTSPQFSFFDSSLQASSSRGCGTFLSPQSSNDTDADFGPDSDVDVVDEFTVGPFALQILRGDSGEALQTWLTDNGYDLPDAAEAPLQAYVDGGMAFMGVKLIPGEVDEGPIDTLAFTYSSGAPMIPLLLTGIAAVPDMPILTYVVADEPMQLGGDYANVDVDFNAIRPASGEFPTSYVPMVRSAVDAAGGRGFVLEWAGDTDSLRDGIPDRGDLAAGKWIGRFRTYMDPDEMTADPVWVRDPDGPLQIDRLRRIDTAGDNARSGLALFGFVPLLMGGLWWRRRS
jgi:hypothetical protein